MGECEVGARISGSGADDRGPCFVALRHQLATPQIEATKSSCFLDSSGKLAAIEVPALLGVGGCECYALGHEETSQERLSLGERGDPALGVPVSTPRRERTKGCWRIGTQGSKMCTIRSGGTWRHLSPVSFPAPKRFANHPW